MGTLSGEQFCHFQVCLPFQGCQLLKEKIGSTRRKYLSLTLKEPITTAADDIHKYFFHFFFFFEKIRLDVSSESSALAEDSHEKSSLIFFER